MVLLVVLPAFLCAVVAVPVPSRPIVVPDLVHTAPVAVVSSQSHAQDELGQYSYSYSNPLSAKVETKTVDGVTRGGYSYLDSHGIIQSVNYVSDDVNGFRVAASNLPLGPVNPQVDEPVVAHQKSIAIAALHEAAVKDTLVGNEVVPPSAAVISSAGPVAYSTAAPPLAVSTPIPPANIHVTPEPGVYSPSPTPVVYVTPAPYRVSSASPLVEYTPHNEPPQSLSSTAGPVPVIHSYSTVELDASDIPAPALAPGAYFRHSPAVVHSAPQPAFEHSANPVVDAPSSASPAIHVTPSPEIVAPVSHAAPLHVAAVPPAVAAPVAVVSSQSHAQDELGQYSYSYSNPLSAKVETKTVDGVTRGGYSYLDSHGIIQSVNYVSDDVNGFRVAASNLPISTVPVEVPDSEDVAAAKQLFFAKLTANHSV